MQSITFIFNPSMSPRPYINSEQRKAETVEAVIKLCGKHNPDELTTSGIASELNLSQGALFRHFPNKKTLWESVARWVAEKLISTVIAVSHESDSPLEGLEATYLAHVDFVVRHPGAPRLIFSELQKPDQSRAREIVQQALDNYRGHIRRLLENGITCGELQKDLDVEAAAIMYLGSIQGLVVQALVSGEISTASQAAPRVFQLFLRAIRKQDA